MRSLHFVLLMYQINQCVDKCLYIVRLRLEVFVSSRRMENVCEKRRSKVHAKMYASMFRCKASFYEV